MVNPYLMHRRKAFRGGAGWTPAQLTTALWLDAADSATLFDATSGGSLVGADGAIARWEDKSGNARHLTQDTASARPSLVADAAINGLVAFYDGGDSLSALAPSVFESIGSASIFLTARQNTTSASARRIFQIDANNRVTLRFFGNQFQIFSARTGSSIGSAPLGGTPGTAWNILQLSCNWQSGQISLFVNGATSSVISCSVGGGAGLTAAGTQGVWLGINFESMSGFIGDCIVCVPAASTEDSQRIVGHLAHKRGLTANLPAGHPYKTLAP